MKRDLYLVAYDVRQPKRLRHALDILKEFASGGQKSVFECYLTIAEKKELLNRTQSVMDLDEDSLLIIRLTSRDAVQIRGLAIKPIDEIYTYLG